MFQALKNLAKRTKTLNQKVLFRFVFSNGDVQNLIIDLNRYEQLFKESELSDGSIIAEEYSRITEQATRESGAVFTFRNSKGESFSRQKTSSDPYFLLDRGDFYKSFKVKVLADGFVIQADTIKDDGTDLLKYGKLLGITNESRKEIVKEILPMVLEKTRETLRG